MGIFGKLVKLTMDVVETPIAIIKDVATLGGELSDEKGTYTGRKMDDIGDDWNDIKNEAGE
jgi:hypothetical protein